MVQKGLDTWNVPKIIKESVNVAKWNPNLAIDWMEDVYNNIQTERQLEIWSKAAKEINFIIDFKEKSGKVNYEEYWGHRLAKSRRITTPIKNNIKGIK
jgi:hypothetical protein